MGGKRANTSLCVACNVRLKSMGSGQGLRCPSCKERSEDVWVEVPTEPRTWDGWSLRRCSSTPRSTLGLGRTGRRQVSSQNDEKERCPVPTMEPETTKNIAYAIMGLSLLLMVWFISQRAMKNRTSMLESSGPKIAGKMRWTAALEILNNLTSRTKMPLRKWPNSSVKMTTQTTKPESSIRSSWVVSPRTGYAGSWTFHAIGAKSRIRSSSSPRPSVQ